MGMRFLVLAAVVTAVGCGSLLGVNDDDDDDAIGSNKNGSDGGSPGGGSSGGSGGPYTSGGDPGGSSGLPPDTGDCEGGEVVCVSQDGCCPHVEDTGTPNHVYAGTSNTCVTTDTGVLACWGSDQLGQLGQGGTQSVGMSNVPLRVRNVEGGVSHVALGREVLFVVADGRLATVGSGQFKQLGDGSDGRRTLAVVDALGPVLHASAGGATGCAVLEGGGVSCWGDNGGKQAGSGDSPRPVPQAIEISGTASLVSVGDSYACAAVDGSVECWGNNTSNRLGRAGPTSTPVPVQVKNLSGTVTSISTGPQHACAIVSGAARCWGGNGFGELGQGTNGVNSDGALTPNGLDAGVTSLCAGFTFSCAVANGEVRCWGANSEGQLGSGNGENNYLPQPVDLGGTAVEVTCNYMHACALREDGAVFCWGNNSFSQLGDGSVEAKSLEPSEVRWSAL